MPKKESLYEQLCKLAKVPPREADESFEDFAARAVERVNKLNDAGWNSLGEDLQTWNNESQKAREQKKEIPVLDGWPDEAPAEEHEEEAPDEEEAAPEDEGSEAEPDATDEPADTEEEPADQESVDSGDDSAQEEESTNDEPEQPKPRQRKTTAPKTTAKTPAKSNKPGKAKDMATKAAPKAAAKPAPKAAPKPTAAKKAAAPKNGGSNDRIGADQTIKVLAKENPHRSGTKLFNWFKKYKDGMTVAAAVKAGVPLSNIRYLRGLGHVKVV